MFLCIPCFNWLQSFFECGIFLTRFDTFVTRENFTVAGNCEVNNPKINTKYPIRIFYQTFIGNFNYKQQIKLFVDINKIRLTSNFILCKFLIFTNYHRNNYPSLKC